MMIIRDLKDVIGFWGIPVVLLVISYFLLRKKKALFFALVSGFIALNIYHFITYVHPHPSDKYNIANRFGLFFKIQSEALFLFLIALTVWFIRRMVERKKDRPAK